MLRTFKKNLKTLAFSCVELVIPLIDDIHHFPQPFVNNLLIYNPNYLILSNLSVALE